jgi:hypothetical protein
VRAIALLFLLPACAPALPASVLEMPPAPVIASASPIAPTAPAPEPAPDPACASDAACGYAPALDRCVADPAANRQPPLVDQGIVCYCEAARCETLRVLPVPCESDESCAVSRDPRPHPVRASTTTPHERRRCDLGTTCERTNICTMQPTPCPKARR